MHVFAVCAGRLSAQMEHQWLMQDEGSNRTQSYQKAMVALLETVTPPDRAVEALSARIEAKHTQAVLLRRGSFGRDAGDAQWARRQADSLVAACTGLLLG